MHAVYLMDLVVIGNNYSDVFCWIKISKKNPKAFIICLVGF